uniref:S8 family peptidase n=1 Tax=Bordetella sputigena TaxID=1416810 RepID=UPI0039F0F5AD
MLAGGLLAPTLAAAVSGLPAQYAPERFRTGEYRASWALDMIHAADAYALGYTGKGVRVGVVDSGDTLTHPEFAGRTGPFIPNERRRLQLTGEAGSHSTSVSGLLAAARDGRGMHGVAYDALLIPVRGGNSDSASQTYIAMRDAIDGGAKVINASYGTDEYLIDFVGSGNEDRYRFNEEAVKTFVLSGESGGLRQLSEEAASVRYAAAHGAVVVYTAGNDYLEHPVAASNVSGYGLLPYIRREHHDSGVYQFVDDAELADALESADYPDSIVPLDSSDSRLAGFDFSDLERDMIVVVALGPDGKIASYSNRCGVAWRWCIAAPGGDVPADWVSWQGSAMYTTDSKGGYKLEGSIGTSYAAPLVSGA